MQFLSNEPLAPRTSLNLGGRAETFVETSDCGQLVEALDWAKESAQPVRLLGGGSNVVVADEGVPGLVIVPALRGIEVNQLAGEVVVIASAGENWDDLVAEMVAHGFLGLECLSGIPGTVGATPIQNVGAYGVEVSDVVEWVEVFDRHAGAEMRLAPAQCEFAYRSSCFRRFPERWVVTRVAFRLRSNGRPLIRYPELVGAVASGTASPDASEVRQVVLALRRSKGMVLNERAPRSAGSFFVNPIVDTGTLATVESSGAGNAVPRYPVGEQLVKIPAAWLIENAGFARGYRRGFVGISEHHALALVHYGGGRTNDLLELAMSIQDAVKKQFGIVLRPEPVFWGCTTSDPLNRGMS